MIGISVYYYLRQMGGYTIVTSLSMHFAKTHIIAFNYYDAGIMDDPVLSKWMTPRERYYAEPHRERLSYGKWINYFYFVGSSLMPLHEYREFEEFINYEGKIA